MDRAAQAGHAAHQRACVLQRQRHAPVERIQQDARIPVAHADDEVTGQADAIGGQPQPLRHLDVERRKRDRQPQPFLHHCVQIAVARVIIILGVAAQPEIIEEIGRQTGGALTQGPGRAARRGLLRPCVQHGEAARGSQLRVGDLARKQEICARQPGPAGGAQLRLERHLIYGIGHDCAKPSKGLQLTALFYHIRDNCSQIRYIDEVENMSDYRMNPAARMGPVHLIVRDLARSLAFYRDLLGLRADTGADGVVTLSVGGEPLVVLRERPDAPAHPPRSTGLYHFAILLPSRLELARALEGLLAAGYPVQGASDHGVSEALYLADPEGNGIEIYRDRERADWPMRGEALTMTTEALDVDGVMGELHGAAGPWAGLPVGTRMGHVHLHVGDLRAAEAFYTGALGLDLMQHYGGSAAFLSAGGYHHHVGVNTWAGVGAPPPPPGATGLEALTVILPTAEDVTQAAAHLAGSGNPVAERPEGVLVHDPSQNAILLTHA